MDGLPYYRRMAGILMDEIGRGTYAIGATLPTERELCQRFEVSRHTTRDALKLLEQKGLIRRRQGSGSTVLSLSPRLRYEQSIQSIDDLMQQGSASRLQVISCEELEPEADPFAHRIGLVARKPCVRVRSIRYLRHDVRPLALVDVYAAVRSRVQARRLLDPEAAAREIVATVEPSRLERIEQAFSAVNVDEESARLLHVAAGDAAFRTVRNYFDVKGNLVVVAHSLYQGQLFTYSSTLWRK
jgi:DNA-binding GntR family transcriptional regulator